LKEQKILDKLEQKRIDKERLKEELGLKIIYYFIMIGS
jgi:hypothetical protein